MKNIIVSELNHVAYVKLHRPEVRNAFNPEMISEVTQIFIDLNLRKDLAAIVLQGEGKAFCAGADLSWMQEMVNFSKEQNVADSRKLFEMFDSILSCELPVVGLAHGSVFGGALGLLACCDYVLAEIGTQFCFSEVKLGLAPAVISAFILKKMNSQAVRHWMLSGQVFNDDQALKMGLIHHIESKDESHKYLQKILHNYIEAGPEAVRETKKLINQVGSLSWDQQKNLTTEVIAGRRVSPEGQEGLKSFFEKRTPSWRKQI